MSAIDNAATQLRAYKIKDLVADVDDIDVNVKAANFSQTYQALSVMVVVNSSRTDAVNYARPRSSGSTASHSSRVSDGSNIEISETSKPEAEVQNLKAVFLSESLRSLGIFFRHQRWKDKLIRLEYLYDTTLDTKH